eukprot:scpid19845/ scgid35116/ 
MLASPRSETSSGLTAATLQERLLHLLARLDAKRKEFVACDLPGELEALDRVRESHANYDEVRAGWRAESVDLEADTHALENSGDLSADAGIVLVQRLADTWCALDSAEDAYSAALQSTWARCVDGSIVSVEQALQDHRLWCDTTAKRIASRQAEFSHTRQTETERDAVVNKLDTEVEERRAAVEYDCWKAEICSKRRPQLASLVNSVESAWQSVHVELKQFRDTLDVSADTAVPIDSEVHASLPAGQSPVGSPPLSSPGALSVNSDDDSRMSLHEAHSDEDNAAGESIGTTTTDVVDNAHAILEQIAEVIAWCDQTSQRLQTQLPDLATHRRTELEDLLDEFDRVVRQRELRKHAAAQLEIRETVGSLPQPSDGILAEMEHLNVAWSSVSREIVTYRQAIMYRLEEIQEESNDTVEANRLLNSIMQLRLAVEDRYGESKQGNSLHQLRMLHAQCRAESGAPDLAAAERQTAELSERLKRYKSTLSGVYSDNLESAIVTLQQVMADICERILRAIGFRQQEYAQLTSTLEDLIALITNCMHAAHSALDSIPPSSPPTPSSREAVAVAVVRCHDAFRESEAFKVDLERRARVFASTERVDMENESEEEKRELDERTVADLRATCTDEVTALHDRMGQLTVEWKRLVDFCLSHPASQYRGVYPEHPGDATSPNQEAAEQPKAIVVEQAAVMSEPPLSSGEESRADEAHSPSLSTKITTGLISPQSGDEPDGPGGDDYPTEPFSDAAADSATSTDGIVAREVLTEPVAARPPLHSPSPHKSADEYLATAAMTGASPARDSSGSEEEQSASDRDGGGYVHTAHTSASKSPDTSAQPVSSVDAAVVGSPVASRVEDATTVRLVSTTHVRTASTPTADGSARVQGAGKDDRPTAARKLVGDDSFDGPDPLGVITPTRSGTERELTVGLLHMHDAIPQQQQRDRVTVGGAFNTGTGAAIQYASSDDLVVLGYRDEEEDDQARTHRLHSLSATGSGTPFAGSISSLLDVHMQNIRVLHVWVETETARLQAADLPLPSTLQQLEEARANVRRFETSVMAQRAAERKELADEQAMYRDLGMVRSNEQAVRMMTQLDQAWTWLERDVFTRKKAIHAAIQRCVIPTPPPGSPVAASGYCKFVVTPLSETAPEPPRNTTAVRWRPPKPLSDPAAAAAAPGEAPNSKDVFELDRPPHRRRKEQPPPFDWKRPLYQLLVDIWFSHKVIVLPF